MKNHSNCGCLVFLAVLCCTVVESTRPTYARFEARKQSVSIESKDASSDPLRQVTAAFPGSVKFKEKQRVLEFCPDNTCDGFVTSQKVSVSTLKDFAYLYIYFFSGYVELPEWRDNAEAKNTADRVLSRSVYAKCKNENRINAATCILLSLSQKGAVKLVFVRYDEGKRNVVPEDIVKELSEKKASR
jgi:hypothetical protein